MVNENLNKLNAARATTHGTFKANAEASQALKSVIMLHTTAKLTDIQKEVLDMVALKISRAITGDNMLPDHWLDMAGYPNLAYAECRQLELDAAAKADQNKIANADLKQAADMAAKLAPRNLAGARSMAEGGFVSEEQK